MDLESTIRKGSMVFVRNNSNPLSRICINMPGGTNGKDELCIIPPHRYPVNLSEKYPMETIYGSYDLRDQLNKEILILVDQDQAKKELSDPKVTSYLRKRFASAYALSSANLSREAEAIARVMNEAKNSALQSDMEADKVEAQNVQVNPKVVGLVNSLDAEDGVVEDILFDLKAIENSLTEADLHFILTSAVGHDAVLGWAEQVFKKVSPEHFAAYEEHKES